MKEMEPFVYDYQICQEEFCYIKFFSKGLLKKTLFSLESCEERERGRERKREREKEREKERQTDRQRERWG